MDYYVDSVTLQHFGYLDMMGLLEQMLQFSAKPLWVAPVKSEVQGSSHLVHCQRVLACDWLGEAHEVPASRLVAVNRVRIGLAGGKYNPKDEGEAASIVLAKDNDRGFLTDDNNAYDFAQKQLGAGVVHDTVWVFRELVAFGIIAAKEAAALASALEPDRRLRRAHEGRTVDPRYYE